MTVASKTHAIPSQCDDIGSHVAMGRGTSVLRSVWVFFVVSALQIINQQLSNQYVAIKVALGVLDLDTFLISDFFPKPDARFNIVNALTGLGTILSVVSGFVSIIEPGLAAIGTILPTVGSFLGNAAASKSDPLVGQKESAPKVQELYNNYFGALDEAGTTLFQGGTVRTAKGGFNITDMMAGGAWVNSSSLTRLRDMETNLTVEILSRSIDALWKTPPSNKMWVLFLNLDDDLESAPKCLADRSGPQDSKYCADATLSKMETSGSGAILAIHGVVICYKKSWN